LEEPRDKQLNWMTFSFVEHVKRLFRRITAAVQPPLQRLPWIPLHLDGVQDIYCENSSFGMFYRLKFPEAKLALESHLKSCGYMEDSDLRDTSLLTQRGSQSV
jgi:hypothetical protein